MEQHAPSPIELQYSRMPLYDNEQGTNAPVFIGKSLGDPKGEGQVFRVANDPTRALKIFLNPTPEDEARIQVMLGQRLSEHDNLGWPLTKRFTIDQYTRRSKFVAFDQPFFGGQNVIPGINFLNNPGDRLDPNPPDFPPIPRDFTFKHMLEFYIAMGKRLSAIQRKSGDVIVDMNPGNVFAKLDRVNGEIVPDALFIDCNSWQIRDNNGKIFPSPGLHQDGYRPPEHDNNFLRQPGNYAKPTADHFLYLVHAYQGLLAASNPLGNNTRRPVLARIGKTGEIAIVNTDAAPGSVATTRDMTTLPLSILDGHLRNVFVRGLITHYDQPDQRPILTEMIEAMEENHAKLEQRCNVPTHFVTRADDPRTDSTHKGCIYCQKRDEEGYDLYPAA